MISEELVTNRLKEIRKIFTLLLRNERKRRIAWTRRVINIGVTWLKTLGGRGGNIDRAYYKLQSSGIKAWLFLDRRDIGGAFGPLSSSQVTPIVTTSPVKPKVDITLKAFNLIFPHKIHQLP